MTAAAEPLGGELPALWYRRLTEALTAAEQQVVVCPHRAGDGLERLVARWGAEGRARTVRPVDLRDPDALSRLLDDENEATMSDVPSWLVGIAPDAESTFEATPFRSALRPGQRLLVLVATPGGVREERDRSRDRSLDPTLRSTEVRDWARRRWSLGLEAAEVEEVLSSCAGTLRRVEIRLGELAEEKPSVRAGRDTREDSGLDDAEATAGAAAQVNRRPPRIELDLLGVPCIRWLRSAHPREVSELRWSYRGVLEVISALAVSPDMRLPGSDLLERLWPKLDPDDARKRLYPAISHARRLFADCAGSESVAIVSSGGVYRLNPDWSWDVDVIRLRDAMRRSAHVTDDLMQVEEGHDPEVPGAQIDDSALRSILETAWSSYRGDFLETLRSAWVRAEREEQRRNYLVVLRRLAALLHVEPEASGLEDVLRTILVADPIAEDAHVALMRLYSRRGRADLVRRQYDRMCRVLMDDLGLQPMDRTVREVERLVAS